jgi:hypothetical protein
VNTNPLLSDDNPNVRTEPLGTNHPLKFPFLNTITPVIKFQPEFEGDIETLAYVLVFFCYFSEIPENRLLYKGKSFTCLTVLEVQGHGVTTSWRIMSQWQETVRSKRCHHQAGS